MPLIRITASGPSRGARSALPPDDREVAAWFAEALALHQRSELPAAQAAYERVLQARPDHFDALHLTGVIAHQAADHARAARLIRQAIGLNPKVAAAHSNLGLALAALGDFEAALASHERAIALQPDYAEAYNNRGVVLKELGRLEAAITSYDRAIAISPGYAQAHFNRGNTLAELGRLDEALDSCDQAIALQPDHADAHWRKSLTLLLSGDLRPGWTLHEWRWRRKGVVSPSLRFTRPLWLGDEPIAGRTVLLHCEQGLGDAIQFCRYARLAKDQGARVIMEVPLPLFRLLESLEGVDHLVAHGQPIPDFDLHCPLMSLPLAFGTTLDSVPGSQAYLRAPPDRIASWRQRLGPRARLRVGIAWRGNSAHGNDRKRSIALASFARLLPGGIDCFSLQKELPDDERACLATLPGIRHFGEHLEDFTDTAALCELMDLVICVDTSVAHLAGALGRPAWILLPAHPDWRWMLGREDSPWYPSVRLYRQSPANDWTPVLERIRGDLTALAKILPQNMDLLFAQALALHRRSELTAARTAYEQVLRAEPDHFDALHLLGVIAHQTGDPQRAARLIRQAIGLNPNVAAAHSNLGLALAALGDFEAALASHERAIALQPDYAEAHNSRGNAFTALGRTQDAIGCHERAVSIRPDYVDAHLNLGNALQRLGRLEQSLHSVERALSIRPAHAGALLNRGTLLLDLRRLDEALDSFERAIECQPDYVDAFVNRAVALTALRRIGEALDSCDRAIALQPGHPGAHWNKAVALLLSGDLQAGWPLHEWRWQREGVVPPATRFAQPQWRGDEPLHGKTILLHGEQGLGDTLQFCRYASLVRARGARVIMEVPAALLGLLGTLAGVDVLVARGTPLPDFDLQCPLMSLPLAFGTTLGNIDRTSPYLRADPSRVASWRQRLGERSRLRVGIAWSGNAAQKNDRNRSMALSTFAGLLPDGVECFSLQKEVREADLATLSALPGIRHVGPDLKDFADTAALCELMDVVVSVDTSVAHLAAALGRPTWILVCGIPDWRWLLGRDDSPWYPTARLFRQGMADDWTPVIGRVRHALGRLQGQAAPAPDAAASFAEGLALHQRSELPAARAAYERVLQARPDHFDALHLTGVIEHQSGDHRRAVRLIGQAIGVNPEVAAAHSNLGLALAALGDFEAALASHDRAIALKPDYAEAHNNRGVALKELGRIDDAVASYEQAIALTPGYAQAHCNLGNALSALGRMDAALACYDRALALSPADARVLTYRAAVLAKLGRNELALDSCDRALSLQPDLAEAHNHRGIVLKDMGRFEEAVESHDRAIAITPDDAQAHNNRAAALAALDRLDAAVAGYDEAIRLRPDFAAALSNRGLALKGIGRLDAGIESCERALAIEPDCFDAHLNLGSLLRDARRPEQALRHLDSALSLHSGSAEAWLNRGNVLKDLDRLEEALESCDHALRARPDYAEAFVNRAVILADLQQTSRALESCERATALRPDHTDAHWNKSLILLLRGELSSGWPLYEWRWKREGIETPATRFARPAWLGDGPLDGATVLLHCEQGLGDTLQFCRYARLVQARGARVIMEVPAPLLGLLGTLEGVDLLVARGQPLPEFDLHCPLMSLPLAFGTTLDNIPNPPRYLHANPDKVSQWRKRLGPARGHRVGVVWSGSTGHGNDRNRSIALSTFAQHLPDGVEYVSLQKELREADRAAMAEVPGLRHFGDEIRDYSDTAAMCELMDMIVSVDTSVAHLAGALGRPTWILLPANPDWRWMLGRGDSPWYPSVRLYRQTRQGGWPALLQRVGRELADALPAGVTAGRESPRRRP